MIKQGLHVIVGIASLPGLQMIAVWQDPIIRQLSAEPAELITWKIWLLPLFLGLLIMGFNIRKWINWGNKTFLVIDVAVAGLVALGLIIIHLINHILSIMKGNNSESDTK